MSSFLTTLLVLASLTLPFTDTPSRVPSYGIDLSMPYCVRPDEYNHTIASRYQMVSCKWKCLGGYTWHVIFFRPTWQYTWSVLEWKIECPGVCVPLRNPYCY